MLIYIRLLIAAIVLLCLSLSAPALCEPAGDLQVTLLPAGAISAGAMWRVVGETTWHASGESVTYGIDSTWPGPTIEFTSLVGWRSPQTRTIALAEDGTVSTTATYYPLSALADSQADFSLTQGNKGWWYGYFSSGTTFTQFAQTQFNATFGNLWYGGNGYLWNAGGHPYDNAHKTVRRWVSSVNGHVLILGHMWRFPGANGGNGFIGSVSVNGVTQYSQAIGGSDNIGVNYSFDAQVTTGSSVDFMIDANGDVTLDNSGLTGIIATSTSTGSLKATIIPSEAAAAGAKWRRVGTAQWFASGETEYDIPVGNYSVEFSALAGWTAPASQSVAIASDGQLCQVNATYTAGSMQVMIQPESAVTAGAQWRRVGTTNWLASGTIESGIPTGSYSVEFAPLAGWRSPQARILTVASEATASTVATYQPSTVVIADSVADFSLTQGYKGWYYGWRPNGTTGFTQFTISGTDSNGQYFWTAGDWSALWASYGHPERANETVRRWISTVTGPAMISGNIWKRVGQNWGNGFVGSVNIDGSQQYTKTIAYNDNTGVPYSLGATLVSGAAVDFVINANGNITSDHAGFTGVIKVPVSTGSLLVTIQPMEAVAAGAKWRRVGTSTWFASGVTDYDVPIGNCSIEFSDLIGWMAPDPKPVTIADGQLCQATGTYPSGSLHVTIQPALAITHGAKWRRVGTTTWLNIGDSESVPPGYYDIEFKKIKCWHEPLAVTAAVTVGSATEITRTYRGGSIVAWGSTIYGGCDVPSPNNDFVAISAGYSTSIGLRSDGSVVTWGTDPNLPSSLPSPNSDFVAVSAGYGYCLGLKSNGSVVAWGLNDSGQCNVPAPNSGFTAIAGGEGGHAIGLKNDGSVVGWGNNYSGAATTQYLGAGVQAIATGISHSLALLPNGSIVGWGYNDVGQLNIAAPNSDFVSIACGNFCSMGVKSDGSLVAWGANDFGQVSPLPSPNLGFVVASANLSVLGLKSDGSVIEWGSRVGSPSPNTGFVAVAAGQNHSLALRIPDFGHLRVTIQPDAAAATGKWRRVGTTKWFASGETEYDVPAGSIVEFSDVANWGKPATQAVTITANQTSEVVGTYLTMVSLKVNIMPPLAVTHKGQWRQVGTTTWLNSGDSIVVPEGDCSVEFKKILGWSTPMTRTVRVAPDNTTQTTGTYHGGAIVAWGDSTKDNLLTLPSPNSEFVAVDGGYYFGAGLKSSGSVVAWGVGYGTQLPSPNSGFMAIACDGERALALRTNGTVASWAGASDPSPNSGFVAVDAGEDECIGLKFDGSVAVWGGNTFRQITDVPNPNSGFTAVAAGGFHCLALKTNGSVKAWGRNADGQSSPPPYYDFIAVSGARYNSLGLKANGMIVGWGNTYYGLNATPYPPANSTYVSVSSSGYHAMALTDTGSITAWGMDYAGSNTVPTPNSGFLAIGAAFSTNFAIRSVDIGALRVTTTPAEGKWRRVGTSTWYASGETEYDVVAGSYSIEFSDLAGWTKPSPIPVTTTTQITQLTATYIAMTLHQAKACADGTVVSISGITISAAWPDVFYIETDNRISGIRVEKPSHGLIYGNMADIVGIIGTNADGERFIQASTAAKIDTEDASVKPLGITNKIIGGCALPWQHGVLNGSGLNNIGLLVRTWGKVMEIEQVTAPALPTWFEIDDGSGTQIKCIVPTGVTINPAWNYVIVTGVSSCEKVGADIGRLIRIRTSDDITSN